MILFPPYFDSTFSFKKAAFHETFQSTHVLDFALSLRRLT